MEVGYQWTPHHEVLHPRRKRGDVAETLTYAGSSHCGHAPATSLASTATTCYSFRHRLRSLFPSPICYSFRHCLRTPFSSPICYSFRYPHHSPFSSSPSAHRRPSPNLSLCYRHGSSRSREAHARVRIELSSTAWFAETESANKGENPANRAEPVWLYCGRNTRACLAAAERYYCGGGVRRENGYWSDGPW